MYSFLGVRVCTYVLIRVRVYSIHSIFITPQFLISRCTADRAARSAVARDYSWRVSASAHRRASAVLDILIDRQCLDVALPRRCTAPAYTALALA